MDWGDSGGFINDSTVEEPQQVTTSVSVGGEDKNKAIASVSVSQVVKLTRPNEGLIINGKKIYHVNLVAMVHEILDISPTKIHICVDDYTSGGPLEVSNIIGDTGTPGEDPSLSMFSDNHTEPEESEVRNLATIKVGDYIRCIGVVKANQDKPTMNAYNIQFIEDPNYITMHILEVIRDSMKYAELQSGISRLPSAVIDNKPTPINQTRQMNDGFGKLSTREKHLLKFLQEKSSDEGIHIKEIVDNFRAFSKDEIEKSLTTLSSEGFCWQGDTEEIWCVNRGDV